MLKMEKRVTIYMLLWTHQVQTLKELDFFAYSLYNTHIINYISRIIILLVFSNGDLFLFIQFVEEIINR